MNMEIFPQEIADGLEHTILSQASVSYASLASPCSSKELQNKAKQFKTTASYNDNDLYYVQSILVSSSWNKNDDIFDKEEVWAAKNTPEDKPTNLEHDESIIIGHIISNWPITEDGLLIDNNTPTENLPNKYHILTGSVIYRAFSNPELKERADKLIAEIENGEKYVSMECMFGGFDYGLIDKTSGQYQIMPRNESTAHLTKYLRAYGGAGEHENYKIGRVLRNIVFSGKGYVAKPANPDSIILNNAFTKNNLTEETKKNIDNFSELGVSKLKSSFNSEAVTMNLDKDVAEIKDQIANLAKSSDSMKDSFSKTAADLQTQYSELSEALKASKEDSEAKANQIAKLDEELQAKSEELVSKTSELETALSQILAHEETIKSQTDEINSLKETIVSSDTVIAEYKMKEEEMKKREMKMKRKAMLLESGLDNESADAAIEQFETLDDTTFEAMTTLLAKKMSKKEMMTEEKKKDKEMASEEDIESEASEDSVSAEILDEVETEAEVNLSVGSSTETEVDTARAALVEFVSSRLNSTKTTK